MRLDQLRLEEKIPRMDEEPLGTRRYSTDTFLVKKHPSHFEVLKCDACGREYAFEKSGGRIFRTCCELCAKLWDMLHKLPKQRFKLYFYRVKLQKEMITGLELPPDVVELVEEPYTPLETKLLDVLRKGPKTREELVLKLNRKRSTIFDALKKLMLKGKVKSYPRYNAIEIERGRPQILFAIDKRIVKLEKKCKICGNDKYHLYEDEQSIQCVKCNSIWRYGENGSES